MSNKRTAYYISCCSLLVVLLSGFGFKYNCDQIANYPYKDIPLISGVIEKKFIVDDSYYVQINSVQKETSKETYNEVAIGKTYEITKTVSNTGKYVFFNFVFGFIFAFSLVSFLTFLISFCSEFC